MHVNESSMKVLEGVDFVAEVMAAGGEESRRKEEANDSASRKRMFDECGIDDEGSSVAAGIKFPARTR